MKRIKIEILQAGDIILTASRTKTGKAVRLATQGEVSHAMICVQHGSVIDSTSAGVQAWNLQREFFKDNEEVFVFRLRTALPLVAMAGVVDFARSEIGTRYSKIEAARSVLAVRKPRNGRQFCSRLVARAYGSVGLSLVEDQDYCTPENLRLSPLLLELSNATEAVTPEEVEFWQRRSNPIQMTVDAQNAILTIARTLDPSVENFADVDQLVHDHPEWDGTIAQAYQNSGYLELWKHELNANPWRYNLSLMESITKPEMLTDLRTSCIDTIREAYSGGLRYAVNLAHYEARQKSSPRLTTALLVNLYQILVRNDLQWRETARAWLMRHHPEDVTAHMERVAPHSELWFSIVDRVEPKLGMLARIAIKHEQSLDVCSSCGDPASDYRIVNSADAMPGVPALRLCDDCVAIRRGFGEQLDPMD
ncbi:YiiX/YebB-like N1pC/P60 family cysteine hydrolase [Sphingobium sp.]|uniref:YiiX/YebB-like N1pC/P60 family cysteine hydrolase n=1 Tax=Sphingobium sp. TaxID=1912891 RepID=UPI003BB4FC81